MQGAYFLFQVVQVFLVTTITSAASGAISQLLEDPMSAREILSENLPKSSNFYVSYFILQGLAMSATRIVNMPALYHALAGRAQSPRLMSRRYHRLRTVYWGTVFPVFTNMGVIGIPPASLLP